MIREAEKSHALPSARWKPRKAAGVVQFKARVLQTRGAEAGEDLCPSSHSQAGGLNSSFSFFSSFVFYSGPQPIG